MSFFQSEVVRAELTEIQELQEEVYGNIFEFPTMDMEDKKYHVDLLERLLNKQQILYTRLSLSDDPQAKMMKNDIMKGASDLGLPPNVDMNVVFNEMTKMLGMMRMHIDKNEL
jgi:hypothetical protein|tara:strand:+ start:32 stop:370 length:339 start_codon:yes stop_codon:yes gene_type:complete